MGIRLFFETVHFTERRKKGFFTLFIRSLPRSSLIIVAWDLGTFCNYKPFESQSAHHATRSSSHFPVLNQAKCLSHKSASDERRLRNKKTIFCRVSSSLVISSTARFPHLGSSAAVGSSKSKQGAFLYFAFARSSLLLFTAGKISRGPLYTSILSMYGVFL